MKPTNHFDDPSPVKSSRRWLEPEEYLALAVSNRKLARCDEPDQGVRGLVDLATGERFCVREERVLLGERSDRHPRDAVSP